MNGLNWGTCGQNRQWCSFEHLDLQNLEFDGVYVIWHDGSARNTSAEVVRIGQGVISQRIAAHRNDDTITSYAVRGTLLVTWAAVAGRERRLGIERYLADELDPLVGEYPDVRPIPVTLPWVD